MLPAALLLALPALATAVDTFGGDALSAGMGGWTDALALDAGVGFTNPAALCHLPALHLYGAGYGLVRSSFERLPPLWWDTNRDGRIDDSDPPLALQPDYDPGDGLYAATAQRVGRLAVGFGLFSPRDRLTRLTTFDASLPHYFLYDSRLQRYAIFGGAGLELLPGLSVGGGFRMLPRAEYDISVTVSAELVATSAEDDSSADLLESVVVDVHEMNLVLVPDLAPLVGLHWELGELVPVLRGTSLAASWRGTTGLPVDGDVDVQLDVSADELGELGPVLLPVVVDFGLDVYDQYLPEQWVLGLGLHPWDFAWGTVEARWTRWSALPINIAQVVDISVEAPLWEVDPEHLEDGNPYQLRFRDTWAVRAGGQLALPRLGPVQLFLRGGGGFEPSPLLEQSAQTALLDADRVVLACGLGIAHPDPLGGPARVRWDLFGQLQELASGSYTRRVPDEPTAGYPRDAEPGSLASLPVGGRIWSTGAELVLAWGAGEEPGS